MKTANLWALFFLTWATCFHRPDSVACNRSPLGTRLTVTSHGRTARVIVTSRLARTGPYIDASPELWHRLGLPLRLGKVEVSVKPTSP